LKINGLWFQAYNFMRHFEVVLQELDFIGSKCDSGRGRKPMGSKFRIRREFSEMAEAVELDSNQNE
jgi:hypothetical protein